MARVTVEDCIEKVPNRFDLVMLAAHRSRGISAGAPPTVDRDNDKNPVVALREIADGTIGVEETYDSLIRGMQRHVEVDEPEEEDALELMAGAMMPGVEADVGDFVRASRSVELDEPEEDEPVELDEPGEDEPVELDAAEEDEPVESDAAGDDQPGELDAGEDDELVKPAVPEEESGQ